MPKIYLHENIIDDEERETESCLNKKYFTQRVSCHALPEIS